MLGLGQGLRRLAGVRRRTPRSGVSPGSGRGGSPAAVGLRRTLRTQPRATRLPSTRDGLGGARHDGQDYRVPRGGSKRGDRADARPGEPRQLGQASSWPGARLRPARSASWVRQEKPSARTTASGPRADGRAEVVLEHRRPTPRSAPSPSRSCRPARSSRRPGSAWRRPAGAAPRRPPSRAPRRGGSAAGRPPRCRRGRAASQPDARRGARPGCAAAPAIGGGPSASRCSESSRSTARQDGSSATTGTPSGTRRRSRSSSRPSRARACSSWPVLIQVSPQHSSSSATTRTRCRRRPRAPRPRRRPPRGRTGW